MPSVRVRRGSQYASLLGDDELQQNRSPTLTRPRSRTLASIYQNADPLTIVNVEQPEAAQPEVASPDRISRLDDTPSRPASKVASTILSQQRSTEALRGYRSHDYANSYRRRTSRASDSRPDNRTHTIEGQQADLVVPDAGRPGLLESQLSFSSAGSNPFNSPSEESLNHEDDIVEHLDVIGTFT